MYKYTLTRQALNFLKKIPPKHAAQILGKIQKLAVDPSSLPSVQLEWFPQFRRVKSGEYRIIYRLDHWDLVLYVLRIGKRNDGEVYKSLEELGSE